MVNAPEAFADPEFRQWLDDEVPKFTWYRGGDLDEWSDVVVLVDPGLNGEGSESSMLEPWWNYIIELCRTHLGPHAPAAPSAKRARLCSIENANRVAGQVAEQMAADTAVVTTGNPLQSFRVVLASAAPPARTVSRVVIAGNDDKPGAA